MTFLDRLNPRPGGGLSHLRPGGGGGGVKITKRLNPRQWRGVGAFPPMSFFSGMAAEPLGRLR